MKKSYKIRTAAVLLASVLAVSNLSLVPVSAAGQKKSNYMKIMSAAESVIKTEADLKNEWMEKETGLVYVDEFTLDEPQALETIDLKECKGPGTFAFEDIKYIPEKGVNSCILVFTPEDVKAHNYSLLKGWDEKTKTVRRYVTIICTSLKLAEEAARVAENTESVENGNTAEDPVVTDTPEITDTPEATPALDETKAPEATEVPETAKSPDAGASAGDDTPSETTKTPETGKIPEATTKPEESDQDDASANAGTDASDEALGTDDVTKPDKKDTASENVKTPDAKSIAAVEDMIQKLSEDTYGKKEVDAVISAAKAYDALDDAERELISAEAKEKFEKARDLAAAFNHESNGVQVTGNIPWYVALIVTLGNDTDNYVPTGLETIVPYDMHLWDLMADCKYVLSPGEKVTLTMDMPDNSDLYDGLTIVHYMDETHYEFIELHIDSDRMSFSTASFSPFNVAGSTVLVGGKQPSSGNGTSTGNNSIGSTSGTSSQTGTSAGNGSTNKGSTDGSGKNNATSANSENAKPDRIIAAQTGDYTAAEEYTVIAAAAAFVCLICIAVMATEKRKKKQ